MTKELSALGAVACMFVAVSASAQVTWQVQSDYFGERNGVAQTRTIRSVAVTPTADAIYTGYIQSPNIGSTALRKVGFGILAVPNTAHVIFGNGMPGGSGAFGQVGGQPVYAGGTTGTYLAWANSDNTPESIAVDDRGNVFVALVSGQNGSVVIHNSDLSAVRHSFNTFGPAFGIDVHRVGDEYFAYVAGNSQLQRWNVTNVASVGFPTNLGFHSRVQAVAVDDDGTMFITRFGTGEPGVVERLNSAGVLTHSVGLANAWGVAVYGGKVYAIRRVNPGDFAVRQYNAADLSSAGPDLVIPDPEPVARPRGAIAQLTAIKVTADGRLVVAEENYTSGSNGIASYTPPVTSFNPTPGAITGRIYFDRVWLSSPVDAVPEP